MLSTEDNFDTIANTPPFALGSIRQLRLHALILVIGRSLGAMLAACGRRIGAVAKSYGRAIELAYVKPYGNSPQLQPPNDETVAAGRDPNW